MIFKKDFGNETYTHVLRSPITIQAGTYYRITYSMHFEKTEVEMWFQSYSYDQPLQELNIITVQ